MAIKGLNPDWIEQPKFKNPTTKIDFIKHKYLDIPYDTVSELQKLDIYLPDTKSSKYPVIINVHGGGFSVCDKRDFHLYPTLFALEQGFAVVSINYRLSPEVKYPTHYYDVMNALNWVSNHAEEYALDVNNMFLWGTSAGGTLVLLAGCKEAFPLPIELQTKNYRIGAIASMCPGIDFTDLAHSKNIFEQLLLKSMIKKTRIGVFGSDKLNETMKFQSNPMNYIKEGYPPLYIQHGDKDPMIPYHQAVALYTHMKPLLAPKDLVLHTLKDGVHAGAKEEFFLIENIQPVFDFFKAHIK
jgi:acetyl esterase/lipase